MAPHNPQDSSHRKWQKPSSHGLDQEMGSLLAHVTEEEVRGLATIGMAGGPRV